MLEKFLKRRRFESLDNQETDYDLAAKIRNNEISQEVLSGLIELHIAGPKIEAIKDYLQSLKHFSIPDKDYCFARFIVTDQLNIVMDTALVPHWEIMHQVGVGWGECFINGGLVSINLNNQHRPVFSYASDIENLPYGSNLKWAVEDRIEMFLKDNKIME